MKLKPAILALAAASLGLVPSQANTTLSLGDISIASANADGPDGFTFVLLKDVDASTVIKFTDGSFKSSGSALAASNFRGSENFVVWTSGSALVAGSVVRMVDNGSGTTVTTGGGTASGALSGLSGGGDQIFAYQGTGTGSNFSGTGATATLNASAILYGINLANSGFLTTGSDTSNLSYRPSELAAQDASLAIPFPIATDFNYAYTAARTGLTLGVYRAALADGINWASFSTNQIQSTTDFTITASASLNWDSNGKGTVGTGGGGTWDTTTQNRFSNGAGDTYLHWVNSSTGNDHTAVFGGTAGVVSLASGGVTASGLTFDVDGYTIQSNTLTLAGATPTISVTTAANSASISSKVSGSNGLTKSGAGTLTLGGANDYTGTTNVTAGKLVVTNTIGTSAVTVTGSGAILASDTVATIGSTLSISNGAILAVGDAANASTATATVTGATTFNNGSIFSWDINAAGTSYDKLISPSLVDGDAAGGAVLRIVAADPAFTNTFWDTNRTWTDIFTTDGSTAIANWASIFTAVSVVNSSFNPITPVDGSFSVSGNTLTWTAVPEPSSALAGLLIAAGLLRRRRVA